MTRLCTLFTLFICMACGNHAEEKSSRVASLPYYQDASFTPHWLSPQSDSLTNFHQIPAFRLTNQEGVEVTEKSVKDKIFIADFFFTTCPGICPKMTANMNVLQQAFLDDDEILLLSHSVTPETDSVPVLAEYALKHNVNSAKWQLLTGDRTQIYKLGRSFYFVEEDLGIDKSEDDFLHTENFVLVDKNRHIRGIYNGLNTTSLQQLIADVKTLQKEG